MANRRPHPAVLAVGSALPPHYASQAEITAALQAAWSRAHYNAERLQELHRAVQVQGRYLALPISRYHELSSFQQRNDAWLTAATELGERALRDALARAGLEPRDVDQLLVVTTTGIATPSLDARLANRLGLRPDVRRTPIFGLGCAGGAGGLARAADFLRAYPGEVAVLVAVEVCSLTMQREDMSIGNIIASGLFGDGAAAVVLAGSRHARSAAGSNGDAPRVLANTSVFYPDTEWVMGWKVVDSGFQIVLSAKVPEVVRAHIRADVDAFLAAHDLQRADIAHWIAHTGGPKVLQAFAEALELPEDALARSWRSLAEAGNVSSVSVLFVLAELLAEKTARPGDWGLLAAMGPGFGSELLLLRW